MGILSEGTKVRILRYDKRPEFKDKEAEIGNFSDKDNTYECWLIAEELEGTYALCAPEDIEVVKEEKAADEPEAGSPGGLFGIGDRVCGKESRSMGTVVSVDSDGDPKVKLDDEDEAKQRFGHEYEVVSKAGPFEVGDRVKGKESGKYGRVVEVDEDGDPKVLLDDDSEPKQRFANEYIITEKGGRSRSRSDGKKKKSKKKRSSSSSSSSSGKRKKKKNKRGRSESSGSRQRLKTRGGFGRSTMEVREDDKRKARKFEKTRGSGADAALAMFGMR